MSVIRTSLIATMVSLSLTQEDTCAAYGTDVSCLENPSCNWCRYKANPSVCMNSTNAQRPHVFACGNQSNPICGLKITGRTCEVNTGCVWCTKTDMLQTSACKPYNSSKLPNWRCKPHFASLEPGAVSPCGDSTDPLEPGTKNVLIIGDSISMAVPYTPGGYGKNVEV